MIYYRTILFNGSELILQKSIFDISITDVSRTIDIIRCLINRWVDIRVMPVPDISTVFSGNNRGFRHINPRCSRFSRMKCPYHFTCRRRLDRLLRNRNDISV